MGTVLRGGRWGSASRSTSLPSKGQNLKRTRGVTDDYGRFGIGQIVFFVLFKVNDVNIYVYAVFTACFCSEQKMVLYYAF